MRSDADHRRRIFAAPTAAKPVDEWVVALRAQRGADVSRSLIELQEDTAEPLVALLHRLLCGDQADLARQRLAGVLAAFLDSPQVRPFRSVWADYTALQPLDAEDADQVRRAPVILAHLLMLADPPQILSFDEALDAGLGLSVDAIDWYRHEFVRADPPPGWTMPEGLHDHARYRVLRDEPRLAYQTRAVRERRLLLRDPYTGAEVVPFDNLSVFGRTAYSFGTDRLTILGTGLFGSSAAYLSLTEHRVLVDLGAGLWDTNLPMFRVTNLHGQLLRRVAQHRALYERARATPPPVAERRRVIAQSMMTENFAHHLWNSFSGWQRLIDAGVAGQVDEIHVGGSEFFGPLMSVFPELANAKLVPETTRGVRDPHPFSHRHLIITPGGYFITRALIDRVVDQMAAAPATPGAALPPAPRGRPFPVVWIGLRVGSRAWIDQETEVPEVIDAIHAAHPEALVVLDGFSRPVGVDDTPARWASVRHELHALAEGIRTATADSGRVLNLVGNTMRESVLWAAATDVYLAPNGTTQHKVGWFTDAPGIVYAGPDLLSRAPGARPGAWESEGRPMPVTVVGEPEVAAAHHALDRRVFTENVRLDRDEVVRTLLELIDLRAAATR